VGLARCDDLDSIPIHCVIAAHEVTRRMAGAAWVRVPYAIRVRPAVCRTIAAGPRIRSAQIVNWLRVLKMLLTCCNI
jgi:hypothetical protein